MRLCIVAPVLGCIALGCQARPPAAAQRAWGAGLTAVLPPPGPVVAYVCRPDTVAYAPYDSTPAQQRCDGPNVTRAALPADRASVWLDAQAQPVAVNRSWSATPASYEATFAAVLRTLEAQHGPATTCGNPAEPWHRGHFWQGPTWYLQLETRWGPSVREIQAYLRPIQPRAEPRCHSPI